MNNISRQTERMSGGSIVGSMSDGRTFQGGGNASFHRHRNWNTYFLLKS